MNSSERPGTTLDPTCTTTKLLIEKGINESNAFVFDTFNRRCHVRRIKKEDGRLWRTFETEPSTWSEQLRQVHDDLRRFIWSRSSEKVLILAGRENRRRFFFDLGHIRSVTLDGCSVEAALMRWGGKITKVVLFIYHPEFVRRTGTSKISRVYDAAFNFAFHLCGLEVDEHAWERSRINRSPSMRRKLKKNVAGGSQTTQTDKDEISSSQVHIDRTTSTYGRDFADRGMHTHNTVHSSVYLSTGLPIKEAVQIAVQPGTLMPTPRIEPNAPHHGIAFQKKNHRAHSEDEAIHHANEEQNTSDASQLLVSYQRNREVAASLHSGYAFSDEADLFRLLAIEKAREEAFGEDISFDMLSDDFLRYITERPALTESFEDFMKRSESSRSAVSALLQIIDPGGNKLKSALNIAKSLSLKYSVIQAVLNAVSRGPQEEEPVEMEVKCARCNGESGTAVDHEPRFTTYNGRYLAKLRACAVCGSRPSSSVAQIHAYTSWCPSSFERNYIELVKLKHKIESHDATLRARSLPLFDRIATISTEIPEYKLFRQMSKEVRATAKLLSIGNLKRDPGLDDPRTVDLQCETCGFQATDSKPKFTLDSHGASRSSMGCSTGTYDNLYKPCKTCQTRRIFSPIDS